MGQFQPLERRDRGDTGSGSKPENSTWWKTKRGLDGSDLITEGDRCFVK
jgi:hypothetical protein